MESRAWTSSVLNMRMVAKMSPRDFARGGLRCCPFS
jgi:hypothetical protein